jgi:hypothetical protein
VTLTDTLVAVVVGRDTGGLPDRAIGVELLRTGQLNEQRNR